jgi:hypothetical protein
VPEIPGPGPEQAFADAERLVREAQRAAEAAVRAAGADVPPRGWAAPGSAAFPDLSAVTALVEALRGTLPPELGQQLTEALRGLLVALRAVLDFSISRLDRPGPEPVDVEDIPVD